MVFASTNADGVRDDVERNVIAGTVGFGILFNSNENGEPTANVVAGNYIGLGADGQTAVPIQDGGGAYYKGGGIYAQWSSRNTIIGGTVPAARNVIGGNEGPGIEIRGDVVDSSLPAHD